MENAQQTYLEETPISRDTWPDLYSSQRHRHIIKTRPCGQTQLVQLTGANPAASYTASAVNIVPQDQVLFVHRLHISFFANAQGAAVTASILELYLMADDKPLLRHYCQRDYLANGQFCSGQINVPVERNISENHSVYLFSCISYAGGGVNSYMDVAVGYVGYLYRKTENNLRGQQFTYANGIASRNLIRNRWLNW